MKPEFTYNSSSSVATNTSELIPFVHLNAGGGGTEFDLTGILSFFTSEGFLSFLSSAWTVISIIAYIISIVLLVLYVYASTRRNLYNGLAEQSLRDAERLYDEHYRGTPQNNRMQDVLNHVDSSNPNDWKLAIIEADIILDEALKEKGYVGNSLGERLKGLTSQQLPSLNDAWEAHKVRNKIAHDGTDFILTKRLAQETVVKYQRVFSDLGLT